jgi:hypothetical protein
MPRELALSPDGSVIAIRDHDSDAWWVFPVPSEGGSYSSGPGLVDTQDGWVLYAAANTQYRLARALEELAERIDEFAYSLGQLAHQVSQVLEEYKPVS